MNPREREKRETSAIVGIFSPEDDDVLNAAQTARAQATQHPSPSANPTAGGEQCPAGDSGGGPAGGAAGGGGAAAASVQDACFSTYCTTGSITNGSGTGQQCCTAYAKFWVTPDAKGGFRASFGPGPKAPHAAVSWDMRPVYTVPDACHGNAKSQAKQWAWECATKAVLWKSIFGPGEQLPGNTPDPPGEFILSSGNGNKYPYFYRFLNDLVSLNAREIKNDPCKINGKITLLDLKSRAMRDITGKDPKAIYGGGSLFSFGLGPEIEILGNVQFNILCQNATACFRPMFPNKILISEASVSSAENTLKLYYSNPNGYPGGLLHHLSDILSQLEHEAIHWLWGTSEEPYELGDRYEALIFGGGLP